MTVQKGFWNKMSLTPFDFTSLFFLKPHDGPVNETSQSNQSGDVVYDRAIN